MLVANTKSKWVNSFKRFFPLRAYLDFSLLNKNPHFK